MSLSAALDDESGLPFMLRAVPTAISALAFYLLYKIIPDRHVPWRHALLGGVVAALLFEGAKECFRIYIHHSTTYNLMYGALAFVPILLAWIYISWLVILFGAELTASAAYWNAGRWKKPSTPAIRFGEAVEVTRCLIEAGEAPRSFDELMRGTRLPSYELEETLSQMMSGGVVRRVDTGYALTQGTRDVLTRAPKQPPARPLKPGKRGKARSGRSSR
jgi:membrane protein